MDGVFARAFLNQPLPACLGRQLVPLTLGHAAYLDVLDSPFVHGRPGTPDDLLVAVFVTTLNLEPLQLLFRDLKAVQREARKWGRSVGAAFDLAAAQEIFVDYLEGELEYPELYREEESSGRLKAPWPWILAYSMVNIGHLSLRDAWHVPVREATALTVAAGDVNGTLDLAAEAEIQTALQKIDELEKTLAKP